MIVAADTGALVVYLAGDRGRSSLVIQEALENDNLRLPPPVITEILAYRFQSPERAALIARSPMLDLREGYWSRAGEARRLLQTLGLKARTVDALVAQCCIDSEVPLIAIDPDFRHFVAHCGLKLV